MPMHLLLICVCSVCWMQWTQWSHWGRSWMSLSWSWVDWRRRRNQEPTSFDLLSTNSSPSTNDSSTTRSTSTTSSLGSVSTWYRLLCVCVLYICCNHRRTLEHVGDLRKLSGDRTSNPRPDTRPISSVALTLENRQRLWFPYANNKYNNIAMILVTLKINMSRVSTIFTFFISKLDRNTAISNINI